MNPNPFLDGDTIEDFVEDFSGTMICPKEGEAEEPQLKLKVQEQLKLTKTLTRWRQYLAR